MINWLWGGMILAGIISGFLRCLFIEDASISLMMDEVFKSASLAVEVVIGLMGMMCLWLGLSNIMDKSGMTEHLAKLLTPLFKVLMPEIPDKHPAIGSITLNLSANMLGLDNAATPLGIRAMRDLETLNPNKGVASNSEIMFLVINTSAVTIFPISVFIFRNKFGAVAPTDVFLPILIATTCSTLAGIFSVAIMQKINLFKLPFVIFVGILFSLITSISLWSVKAGSALIFQATSLSNAIIMLFIGFVIFYGLLKKVKVFDAFVTGSREAVTVTFEILPFLCAMLFAISMIKAGGMLEYLVNTIRKIFEFLSLDTAFVEALPVSLMSPLSGSGARAMMLDVFNTQGVDSFAGHVASVMQGSTETTFYVIAVYFGAVGITKVRHAIGCGLFADFVSMVAAVVISYIFFG